MTNGSTAGQGDRAHMLGGGMTRDQRKQVILYLLAGIQPWSCSTREIAQEMGMTSRFGFTRRSMELRVYSDLSDLYYEGLVERFRPIIAGEDTLWAAVME